MTVPFSSETSAKAREQTDMQRVIYTKKHADDDYWVDLAREARINLPMYYVRPSDAAVKGLLRRLKVSWIAYLESYGWETTAEFEALNPKFSMRPLAGLILELWDEQRRSQASCQAAANMRGLTVGNAEIKDHKYPRGVSKSKRKPLKEIYVGS
tara:strand:- start:47 stop:508 length:462 start_codon:yes stop_codon:yes gene_type:complete